MTSFSRKLYMSSPAAADDFYRSQQFDLRASLGRPGPTRPVQFGKRTVPPVQMAYCCYAPEMLDFNGRAFPKRMVWAQNSFEARRQYAAHYNLPIVEVTAVARNSPSFERVTGPVRLGRH